MPKATASPDKNATSREPNAGFAKPVQPDQVLAAIVGSKALPRTENAKQAWEYVCKSNL